MHPFAITPHFDNTCPAQIGKVPGDFGLVGSENLYEKADANLAIGDEVQQAQARPVRKRAEE